MLTASLDSTFRIWDLKESSHIPRDIFYEFENPIIGGGVGPDSTIGLLDSEGTVLFRGRDQKDRKIQLKKGKYYDLKFDEQDSTKVVIQAEDRLVTVDLRKELEVFSEEVGEVNFFEFDSENLILASKDKVEQRQKGSTVAEWVMDSRVTCLKRLVSQDRKGRLLVGTETGSVRYSIN